MSKADATKTASKKPKDIINEDAVGEKNNKNVPQHRVKKSHVWRNLGIAAVVVAAAGVGVTGVVANRYESIYPNTYLAGQNVSRMSKEQLAGFVASTYNAEHLDNTEFTIICKDTKVALKTSDLKVSFDTDATVEQVLSSGKNGSAINKTIDYVKRFFAKEEVKPVINYDKEKLASALNEAAKSYEYDPVGHTFKMNDDSITIIGPVNGIKADRDVAMDAAESQLAAMKPGEIQLNPQSVKPAPLNENEFYAWLTSDAESAYYEKKDGKVTVHEGKSKCDISREDLKSALSQLKNSEDNTITVSATITEPKENTQVLTDNLYKDKLGSYTTNYGASSAARANNVRLATNRINGTELMPDEEFSYDKTILPRTSANGYMAAPVYVGNKVESGLGGGICQPSSTLYCAALYANLEILERHNHSLSVSYLPPGMDATIAEGVLDLRFKNTTGYPIKISASAEGGILTFDIYGYNPNNTSVELQRSAKGGVYYLTRVVKQNGEVIKTEAMGNSSYGSH